MDSNKSLRKIDTFTLFSDGMQGQALKKYVMNSFGCDGQNISPELSWVNPPKGTKSFAITMFDPDAPTGSGWWHWVVFNIPATVSEIPERAGDISLHLMPKGVVQSRNNRGEFGYEGPCPPIGDGPHAYIITIYALDVKYLDLDRNAEAAMVGFELNEHTLQKASIITYYQRDE